MANNIPLSGASDAAGGYLLPTEQGDLLTNGLLQQNGAIALVGDSRATSRRKSEFPIWLGQPTAGFVGEGAAKPVTGAEFGQATLNVKKVATIVLFTDEQLEDVQDGNMNVLIDSNVRSAFRDLIDAHIIGKDSGTNITSSFDSMLRSTSQTVELGSGADALPAAISAAMGKLEANGYDDAGQMGLLLAPGFRQVVRDAREDTGTIPLYGARDPFQGLSPQFSSNLSAAATAAGANVIKGFLVYRPNLHMRIRKDVVLDVSREASIDVDGTVRNLFQENLTAVRYEARLGFMVHDINRAVVAIVDAS